MVYQDVEVFTESHVELGKANIFTVYPKSYTGAKFGCVLYGKM